MVLKATAQPSCDDQRHIRLASIQRMTIAHSMVDALFF